MNASSPIGNAAAVEGRRPRSIAVYLFVLALVALVPAFAFSAILLQRNNEAQERVVETLITGSTRSIMQAVDREVYANISMLKVMASDPALESGAFEEFYHRVQSALLGTATYVFATDRQFKRLFTTRLPFDSPQVAVTDPDSAEEAFVTGDYVVSGLVINPATHVQSFSVRYPVTGHVKGPILIGISRDANSLEAALLSDKLPTGWNVAMVDTDGIIIAASEGAGETGEKFALADVGSLTSSTGLVTLHSDGETYRAAIRQSPLTHWTLVAWAPASVISRPLVDAVWSLAVGGMLLAAVVVLVVYWVTLQIGRSVRGLENEAKRLGSGQPVTARDYPISEIATVSRALEDASRRRQQAETEVRFLMRELAHRSKNQMTVIAAMAKQTARGADSVPEFVQNFEKRIFGLARSTDLLLANGVVGVDLHELILGQLDPFRPEDEKRLTIEGPPARLNNQAAQIIGMAAHELATNAVKYGAFQRDAGRLAVTWRREGDTLALSWRETTPAFRPPGERRGFGTAVLENMLGRSLGASVERIVHDDGLEWRFGIPGASIDASRAADETETT